MLLFKHRDVADTLEDLLDRERAAILGGRFDLLNRLLVEKQRLSVAKLNRPSAERLASLRQKVDRNQAMLEAVARGIRTVSDRLGQAMEGRNSFTTYDRSGNRPQHVPANGQVQQKV